MFTADVVPFAMGTGMGYYSVYNLTVLSAEKGTFQDWQPTLNKVLSSLNYTPEFQSFAMSQSNQAASTSQSLSSQPVRCPTASCLPGKTGTGARIL